ncbi:MAG: hypothetical protein ACYC2I_13250 [Elusimicrobiales bacterium]
MNKNLICLSVGLCLCAGAYPVMAQKSSSGPVTVTVSKQKQIEVKDYKSFKEYVANEGALLKTKPVTTDDGPVKEKLKKIGVHFEEGRLAAESADGDKIAYVSPDKKGIAVVYRGEKTINLFDPEGVLFKKVQMKKQPVVRVGFSQNRVFEFKGDFEDWIGGIDVYDFSGKLIRSIADSGDVQDYMLSHNQKWLAISAGGLPDDDRTYFILYDMNGEEIWRRETMAVSHPQMEFSRDDKYVSLKLPTYFTDVKNSKSVGFKWVYVFRVSDGHLISAGHYEN